MYNNTNVNVIYKGVFVVGKFIYGLLIFTVLSACGLNQLNVDKPNTSGEMKVETIKDEYINFYNEYSKYIVETKSAVDTAIKSCDVLEFMKSNPDYNINGLDEKANKMLNRALTYAFENNITVPELDELKYIVSTDYVDDSVKEVYCI